MRVAFAEHTSHPHFRLWIASLEEIHAFDSAARLLGWYWINLCRTDVLNYLKSVNEVHV